VAAPQRDDKADCEWSRHVAELAAASLATAKIVAHFERAATIIAGPSLGPEHSQQP